jgi:hypothetical protein
VVLEPASDFPSPPKGLEREVNLSPIDWEKGGGGGVEQHPKDCDNKMGDSIKSKDSYIKRHLQNLVE